MSADKLNVNLIVDRLALMNIRSDRQLLVEQTIDLLRDQAKTIQNQRKQLAALQQKLIAVSGGEDAS